MTPISPVVPGMESVVTRWKPSIRTPLQQVKLDTLCPVKVGK